MQKLAEPALSVMHISVQLPQNPKVVAATSVSTESATNGFGEMMEGAMVEGTSNEVLAEEPLPAVETDEVSLPTPVPQDPFAGAFAVAMVANPTVQAAVSVQSEPVGKPVTPAVAAVKEPAHAPVDVLPEAPKGVRLDVAVVEVPPQEDHEAAVIEVDEDPDLELDGDELQAEPSEQEDPIEDVPSETEADRSDDYTSSHTSEPHRVQAGEKIETPHGFEVRVDNHRLVRELADRLEMMAAGRQKDGVMVQMEPPELGQITLLVKPEANGSVSAQITATHDQVLQALETSQPEIQRRLELRGVAVANVQVSAEASNYQPKDNPSQSSSQGSSPEPRREPTRSSSISSSTPTPPIRRIRKASGVDLWI